MVLGEGWYWGRGGIGGGVLGEGWYWGRGIGGGVLGEEVNGGAVLWRGLTVPPQFPPQPFHSVFSLT